MVRYFIALLPPQEIQAAASQVQQCFADQYASRKAQNSPPHITLQPPFEWPREQAFILEQCLLNFARNYQAIPLKLLDFGAFAPRVIYINVLKTPELLLLQAELSAYLERELKIVDRTAKKRQYAPHLTVASRDLTGANFWTAWAEFQHQPFQCEFTTPALTLLIHNGQRWVMGADFSFSASISSSVSLKLRYSNPK